MIDGVRFIEENYPRVNNFNDVELYKTLYHPDALWCPPGFEDKRGADQIGFAFGFKDFTIEVEIKELEGLNGVDHSYVTGLVGVKTFEKDGAFRKELLLRGSWVVVEYDGRPVIRYQVWNEKEI